MTNRLFVCLITLTLLLGVASAPLAAQEDTYVVQKGDNLWNLAGSHLDSPLLWEQIYRDNPFLREPGRRFQKDGIVYVMVRPGEKLVGLEKLGIIAEITPIDKLELAQPAPVVVHEKITSPFAWGLFVLALLALIAVYLIYRMLTRDPATSGTPIVPDGVTPENAGSHIQQMAARQNQARTGITVPAQQFTVLRQTAGRIWGVMNVRYADGRSVPRQLHGDRAYEALVRFPNGTEETLYMLQACGNDLRYGGISRYLPGPEFRFEADPAPVVVPQPAPAAAEPAPAPMPVAEPVPAASPVVAEPATVAQAQTPTPQEDGVVTFEFKRATNGQPNLVRLQGIEAEDFHFSVGPNGTTLRYREMAETVGKN